MRNSGFTIIELMIVVSIIAILAAVAGPAMMNWRGDSALQSAHVNMKTAIEMAKLRAIKERAPVTVVFGQTGYTIFLDDGEDAAGQIDQNRRGNGVRENPEPLLKGVILDPPITLNADALEGSVTFDTRGFTQGAESGDVIIGNGDMQRVVNISLIGRITTP
jgi:type IV fimbrial biogenesis protein FimT